ncbi:14587_t:CDS:2, partial [Gigaspora margarita]
KELALRTSKSTHYCNKMQHLLKLSNQQNSNIAQFFDQLSNNEQKEHEFSFAKAISQYDNEIKVYIYNKNFWNKLKSLLNLLEQLVIGIYIFESDIPKLSEFYKWYNKILALEHK